VTLLSFAAELRRRCHCAPAVQQSIDIKTDISCSPGAQQQTHNSRMRRANGETDGHHTVTRTLTKPVAVNTGLALPLCIPSPHHSFIPGLKPSFLQILPTAAFPFLFQD